MHSLILGEFPCDQGLVYLCFSFCELSISFVCFPSELLAFFLENFIFLIEV